MPTANSPVVSVRVSPAEKDLLEAAAEHARTTLSDFIRRKAVEAAEIDVCMNPVVTIPAEHWEKFEAWLQSPPRDVPALRELAQHRPVWEK